MTDTLVGRLIRIADASRREDGTDIPLGEQCREAAAEIERQGRIIDAHQQQIIDAGEIMKHWQARALAAESSLSEAVKAAREDEREGCALVAENAYTGRTKTGIHPLQIARAIRARAVIDSDKV